MTTQTPTAPPSVDAELSLQSAYLEETPSHESRLQRRKRKRERRELLLAFLVCAGVPIATVASLWSNLTEPFWFNEQWRAYYISNSGNWWRP